jgi:hypothetical protein
MAVSAKISPVNSLVFIHGPRGWTPPLPIDGKLIWSTPSCIATACFPEVEGPTEIILGDTQEVDPRAAIAFEGMLETPQRAVVITTVDNDQPFLSFGAAGLLTRVRIWHSHPRWPEKVTIGLG